ncbi:MAG: acyl--CoA ligase [Deltaproteobacteria bacterium]|nr:acyl--CoA ligase [Deltaproteobacteria bacterium]
MVEIAKRDGVPQCTLDNFERDFADRHLLHGIVAKWAKETPQDLAVINADTKVTVTWERFDKATTAMAMKLLDMGFVKGDYFATSLPLLTEHLFLEYACFKIGVRFVPLDLRLKPPEVIRSLSLVHAKGYGFLGKTDAADFRELAKAVRANCPFVEHLIQFSPPEQDVLDGAKAAFEFAAEAAQLAVNAFSAGEGSPLMKKYVEVVGSIGEDDGCLVIFTTGSTGYPKPALLSHRNITCQNMCLGEAFDMTKNARMLVNLPPSHVGCQTEQLMTPLFFGQTVVILHIFDAEKSLKAIQDYRVNCFGQIPALFNMEWMLPNYGDFDLDSLRFALYGGQQVSRQFLEKLSAMAPGFGTGLGLTETAGFATYSPLDGTVDDILAGIGYDMPVYPMSIRGPMKEDGSAGDELREGETGNICFKGPQTFLGYVNDPDATARTISVDGYLYTGDLGFKDAKGLHFAGRQKWVIKPKGYQVFPAQVEEQLAELEDKVGMVGVVGVEHDVFSEGIVAFVEKKAGAELTVEELQAHAKETLASYMRPGHYVLVEPGEFPLNRVAKTDYVTLSEMAKAEVERLRAAGGWDRQSERTFPFMRQPRGLRWSWRSCPARRRRPALLPLTGRPTASTPWSCPQRTALGACVFRPRSRACCNTTARTPAGAGKTPCVPG